MGCGSGCGCEDCNNLNLLIPADGQQGERGQAGSPCGYYQFDTATAGSPASGYLSFNASNLTAATEFYIHQNDTNGTNLAGWLVPFLYNSTNGTKSFFQVTSESDSTAFVIFEVTAVVGFAASVLTVTVLHLASSSNTPFLDDGNVVFGYSKTGDDGAAGAAGTNGTTVLSNSNTTVNSGNTASAWVTQKTYTILANELDVNGDVVSVSSQGVNADATYAVDGAVNQFRIQVTNNAVVHTSSHTFSSYLEQARIDLVLNRIGATSIRVIVTVTVGGVITYIGQSDMTAIDLTLTTVVNVQANTTVAEVSTLNLILTKYNA